jgi:beta-galactosidase
LKITYDSKSFLIDGERKFILSGEVHYFRLPQTEWKTALNEIKNCGLNAVSTYIPWNFHEPQEGKWDFKGDRDLEAFLKLCKQLKLLVIAKPGPFIRSEWNFGGFPAWLHSKEVMHLRTSDSKYLQAVDHYLDKILAILARHQVSKNGPVFLVQIEDTFDQAPQDPAYLKHLENRFKKKLSCPLYFSLGNTSMGGGFVKGAMIAACAYQRPIQHLKYVKKMATGRQPLMLSQFWTGRYTAWGAPRETRKSWMLENRLDEALSAGAALINLTMFVGGTNFEDHSGRSIGGDKFFCTTSYDFDAPVNEYLQKTPKALALSLWARWARCQEPGFLGSEILEEDHPVVPSELQVTARGNGDTRLYFVHNPTSQVINGKIQVDDPIYFTLKPDETRVFSYNIPLSENLSVRASSHPYFFKKLGSRVVVVLWGKPGDKLNFYCSGTLDVTEKSSEDVVLEHERKGFLLSAEFNSRPQNLQAKVLFENGKKEIIFLILPIALAQQHSCCSEAELMVLGSVDVDFKKKKARLQPGSQTLIRVGEKDYKEDYVTVKETANQSVKISGGKFFDTALLYEHLQNRKDWKDAEPGRDLAEYGFTSSRAVYKLEFQNKLKEKKTLVFPGMEDEFLTLHNGKNLGLYGRLGKGPMLNVTANSGENILYLLTHSWGRYSFGTKLGEKKGMTLPVFDGGTMEDFSQTWHFLEAAGPLDFKIFSSPTFNGRGWETGDLMNALSRGGYVCARKKFKVPEIARQVRMDLHAGDVDIQVALNGRLVGRHPDYLGSQYKEIDLTPYLIPGENTVALFFKGPTKDWRMAKILFLGSKLDCSLRVAEGFFASDETLVLKNKNWSRSQKSGQGFWHAQFKGPGSKDVCAAMLKPLKTGRGCIWVNGHNLGRHWNIGPQQEYKIPLSWLKPVNDLLLLEEEATQPLDAEIIYVSPLTEIKFP